MHCSSVRVEECLHFRTKAIQLLHGGDDSAIYHEIRSRVKAPFTRSISSENCLEIASHVVSCRAVSRRRWISNWGESGFHWSPLLNTQERKDFGLVRQFKYEYSSSQRFALLEARYYCNA